MQEFDGNFEMVDPREIRFDPKYQREEKWPLVTHIASNPIWPAFGVVLCSRRTYAGETLWGFDGQQRTLGVLAAENPPAKIPVLWWPVKTPAEEAALFDTINTNRKAVASLEKFKARLAAKNVTYLRIAKAVEAASYAIGPSTESNRAIAAVGAIEKIYNTVGEEGVFIGLSAWSDAWPDEAAPTATLLVGLADVMDEMAANGGLSRDRLAKGLARTSPGRLLRKSENIRYDQGLTKREAVRRAFKELAKL